MYLIFLLLLTLLIFKTLFSSFGFNTTQDKERAIKDFIDKVSNSDKVIDGQVIEKTSYKNNENNDSKLDLSKIYNNYLNKKNSEITTSNVFNKDLFLKSSDKAVFFILEYFSNENLPFLKALLTENAYNIFENQIDINKRKSLIYKTILISINKNEILELSNFDTKVKLKLDMSQINYVEDLNGNIISGSKDLVKNISEVWVFVKSGDLWLLDSIE